jgi:hypothetical protein
MLATIESGSPMSSSGFGVTVAARRGEIVPLDKTASHRGRPSSAVDWRCRTAADSIAANPSA